MNGHPRKRREVPDREPSPVINVCDTTTTAISVTSELMTSESKTSDTRFCLEEQPRKVPSTFFITENLKSHEKDATSHTLSSNAKSRSAGLRKMPGISHSRSGGNHHKQARSHYASRTPTGDERDQVKQPPSLGHMRSQVANVSYNNDRYHHEDLPSVYGLSQIMDKATTVNLNLSHRGVQQEAEREFHRLLQAELGVHADHHDSSSDEDSGRFSPGRKFPRYSDTGRRSSSKVTDETTRQGSRTPTSLDAATHHKSKVPEEIRLRINSRERQRMHDLNSALDSLRQVMPYSSGPAVKKLSKMSTLLLARNYIVMLTKSVEDMKRLVQELTATRRLPVSLPVPSSILHDKPISASLLAASNTSGLHSLSIPPQFLQSPPTSVHCMTSSSPCVSCSCVHCLAKRQAAPGMVASLMAWKPG